jgi:chromate transport protein ChrA
MRNEGLAISVVLWALIGCSTWLIGRNRSKLPASFVGAWFGFVTAVVATAVSEAVWGFPQVMKEQPSDWEDVVRAPVILLLYSAAMCFLPLLAVGVVGALVGVATAKVHPAGRE